MTLLSLKTINVEPTIHPRNSIFWHTSYNYYLAMRSGAKFPAVTVTKIQDKYILVDGVHRYKAAKMIQRFQKIEDGQIEAEIIKCKGLDEAYVEAVRRNIKHGQPLSPYEKLEIHNRLKSQGWKHQAIANLLQIPPAKLQKFVEQRVLQKQEGPVTLKAPFGHLDRTANITKESQKFYSAISQLNLVKQLTMMIQEGWLEIGNEELTKALKELKEVLAAIDF